MKTIQDLFKEMDQIYLEFNENIDEFINKRKNYEINEMAKYIDDFQMECNKYYKDKEDVIKTFEERCK